MIAHTITIENQPTTLARQSTAKKRNNGLNGGIMHANKSKIKNSLTISMSLFLYRFCAYNNIIT